MATPNSNDANKPGNEIEEIVVEILRTAHEYLKKQLEVERISKGDQSFTANDFLILEELRLEYDREMKTRKNIEAKAGSLITVSGAIIAILFGFTTFFFSTVRNNALLVTDFIIIASAASITLAIIFSSLELCCINYYHICRV